MVHCLDGVDSTLSRWKCHERTAWKENYGGDYRVMWCFFLFGFFIMWARSGSCNFEPFLCPLNCRLLKIEHLWIFENPNLLTVFCASPYLLPYTENHIIQEMIVIIKVVGIQMPFLIYGVFQYYSRVQNST